MKFLYVSRAISMLLFAVVDAGYRSLPITRTSLALHFTDPDLFQETRSNLHQSVLAARSRRLSQLFNSDQDASASGILQKDLPRISINDSPDDDDDSWDTMYWSIYTTPVSVGNPQLNLTAVVDTSWSTFFVPSVNCTYNPKERKYCSIHPLYNSSLSSTYHAILTPSSVLYTGPAGLYTWGNVSQDSIHVAGLEIKEQVFEEATMLRPDISTRDDLFDTALGLALYPARNGDQPKDFSAPSPFHNMIQQGLLDENLVSLRLARTDDETGEIIFGSLPQQLQREDLIEIPLDHCKTDDSDHIWRYYTMNGWQVSVDSMSMSFNRNRSGPPMPVMETPHIAIVSSSFPWIGISDEVAHKIHESIGIRQGFDWIDCEERRNLPNWTIIFGPHKQPLTLTPYDYLIEMQDKLNMQLKCVSGFFPLSEYGNKGFMILGAPFLNGLDSVFDADRKSISFRNRPL